MQRHYRTRALLLKSEPLGESHRLGHFLSPDLGLFRAALFGARNLHSKLGPYAVPFQHLEVWLYHQAQRDFWKVTEAREVEALEGLRDGLERFFAASVWAELALYSHSGGDWESSYRVLAGGLSLLSRWPEAEVRPLCVQFCLKWVQFLGYPFDLNAVSRDRSRAVRDILERGSADWLRDQVAAPLGEYGLCAELPLVETEVFRYLEQVVGRPLQSVRAWRQSIDRGG